MVHYFINIVLITSKIIVINFGEAPTFARHVNKYFTYINSAHLPKKSLVPLFTVRRKEMLKNLIEV